MEVVTVKRDEFMQLLELAGDAIVAQNNEYSNPPTDAERELMPLIYSQIGEDMPEELAGLFKRTA